MMKVLLVSGFLGAGKTTLVKHLLQSEVHADEKVAVIVNEVGEIGIDGEIIAGRDVDVLELTSGCICCTIKTDFFKAVQEIYDRIKPTYLVVETTGVAQPGDILDILFEPPVSEFSHLKSLITVVDAGFFEVREVLGTFYDNQIKCADILILNKIDQVDSDQIKEIEAVIRALNPQTQIIPARYCAVDLTRLIKAKSNDQQRRAHGLDHFGAYDQKGFQTFSFQDDRFMDKERFVHFLSSLPPTLFRCKGWVRFKEASGLLNFTGRSYRIEPVEDKRQNSLVFVGRNCSEKDILRALEDCLA